MSLIDAIAKLRETKQAIADGRYLDAWEHTLAIQQFLINTGRSFGIQTTSSPGFKQADIDTFNATLLECQTLASGITAASGPEAAKIGDGTFLKLLLELLLKFGPIFLKP